MLVKRRAVSGNEIDFYVDCFVFLLKSTEYFFLLLLFSFRQIFERVIHINLSSKKMKLFFKRYLDFERKYGDAFSVENVKTKAMEYVESKAALS